MRILWITVLLTVIAAPTVLAHYATSDSNTGIAFRPIEPPVAGELVTIDILPVNEKNVSILQLDTVHERIMHVLIIGSNLATFNHLHPEDFQHGLAFQWIGAYSVETTFPYAGDYLIIADYTSNGVSRRAVFPITVPASTKPGAIVSPPMPKPVVDFANKKQFGQYDVTLEHSEIVAGKDVELVYSISQNGVPVQTLGQYLGSEMHVVGTRADLQFPFHTHAYIPGHSVHAGVMPQRYIGPNVPVHLTFPEPGTYVLFSQFNASNTLVTTQFLVEVEQAHAMKQGSVGEVVAAITLFLIVIASFIWWYRRPQN